MGNIKLNYLYRDYGNYKNHSAAVFSNPNNLTIEHLMPLILGKLLDETWFYSSQWGLNDLHFEKYDDELDHSFHEFGSLEYTDEPTTENIPIEEFLILVSRSNICG